MHNINICDVVSIEKFFTSEECKKIIALGNSLKLEPARIRTNEPGDKKVIDQKIRMAELGHFDFSDKHTWIYDRLTNVAKEANLQFKMRLAFTFSDGIVFLKYKQGGHHKPHQDIGVGSAASRRLSIVVQLSSGEEYSEGNLCFLPRTFASRNQGSVTIFRSNLVHCVTPLESGTRYVLAAWVTANLS